MILLRIFYYNIAFNEEHKNDYNITLSKIEYTK